MGDSVLKLLSAVALASVVVIPNARAADGSQGRIAIIDASQNTTSILPKLRAAGVKVIGRYLGRCPQWEGKRLIDNGTGPGSEISAILDGDFAVLSIYQYYSNNKLKFDGKRYDEDTGKTFVLNDAKCQGPANPPHTVEQEAKLDAEAAVTQAKDLGQPPATAIYFGMDFDFHKEDADTKRKMLAYFQTVSSIVRQAGYLVGAYGSGDTLSLLKEKNPPLIDYAWLSASRSYGGSTAFHNSGKWNLFQSWTDVPWFAKSADGKCAKGTGLDTDIQNKAFASEPIGFWHRGGSYKVPAEITNEIYDLHRFACDGDALIRLTDALPPGELASTARCGRPYVKCEPKLPRGVVPQICFAHTVRVGADNGTLVQIDYDDDGEYDGWTRITNLTKSFAAKPTYIKGDQERRRARCPQ